ncbi:MAG: amidohydrolase family protein [Treponema sp.]|nr:amidohydrolase family protein [Treponema sp.]
MEYALRGRLIDAVSDEAIPDGLVVVTGELIKYSGVYNENEVPKGAHVFSLADGTIMPGFIDCHAHLVGESTAGKGGLSDDKLLSAAHEIGILLDSGFTGLRDMSVNGFSLARAVERGYLRGPRIMPGGRVLSCTSGHVDLEPGVSKDYYNATSRMARLCDGVDDCLLAVREQFRLGAKFIKICATGGVSSTVDAMDDVQFSFDEIKAITDEAKRHDTYVTAHCTGDAGTKQAILAGVMCIEHGIMLEKDTVKMMAERSIPLVTTLSVSLGVANIPGLHPAVAAKAKMCAEANIRTIGFARELGIKIALGTDYSNTQNSPYKNNGKEFISMTKAGMTPMESIKAGTINAASVMKNDEVLGSLVKGKIADIVIVQGDPIKDIACLADEDNVKLVIKNGIVEKNTIDK